MRHLLFYIWQLPQNLVGLLLRFTYHGNDVEHNGIIVRRSKRMRGGISLGKYIIVNQFASKNTLLHEYGHCKQSIYLGWLYLIIIGLQSIAHAALCKCKNHSYYDMWFEKWADKLGGVIR
jgi:hypothetical protein